MFSLRSDVKRQIDVKHEECSSLALRVRIHIFRGSQFWDEVSFSVFYKCAHIRMLNLSNIQNMKCIKFLRSNLALKALKLKCMPVYSQKEIEKLAHFWEKIMIIHLKTFPKMGISIWAHLGFILNSELARGDIARQQLWKGCSQRWNKLFTKW